MSKRCESCEVLRARVEHLERELRYVLNKAKQNPRTPLNSTFCNGCGKWLSLNTRHMCPGRPMSAR